MLAKITPCLCFDTQAEEAAQFYVSIFPGSKITKITRMPANEHELHGQRVGDVLTVAFELGGTPFTALNGGPYFKFNEAVSLQIECATQEEVDYYWEKLSAGGDPDAQQCGWVQDRFGLSWQVVPKIFPEAIGAAEPEKARRAFQAMLQMKKLDIAAMQRAVEG